MTSKDRIILQKISSNIDDVIRYVDGFTFEQFMTDKKTISACAFTVSQISELAKDISIRTQQGYPNIPWKNIRGMRNKILHDYENIDLAVLWGTIVKSLPELMNQIDGILYLEIEETNILAQLKANDKSARISIIFIRFNFYCIHLILFAIIRM